MAKVTCVGCGMMGSNLVSAFMQAGHEVNIVDINRESAIPYIEKGAHYTDDINKALDCDFIILSLPNDNIVKAIFDKCDKEKVKNMIVVNTSSEIPSEVVFMQEYFKKMNVKYIDSTILTYQGEVGSKYGYLLYSGEEEAYEKIEEVLSALSDQPIYLGESIVGAEIVDLVAITAHFGITYTPLEDLSLCKENDIDLDEYFEGLNIVLQDISANCNINMNNCLKQCIDVKDKSKSLALCNEYLRNEKIEMHINEKWLAGINKSVGNHFNKMLKIYKSNYKF